MPFPVQTVPTHSLDTLMSAKSSPWGRNKPLVQKLPRRANLPVPADDPQDVRRTKGKDFVKSQTMPDRQISQAPTSSSTGAV